MLAKINYEQGELDMADWVARTSLELIGQAGLGYSFESFEDNNANPYTTAVKTYMSVSVAFCVCAVLTKMGMLGGPGSVCPL